MLKAIIFDVGGVLLRTHSWAGREKWATRLGMSASDFEHFVFNNESGQQAQLGQKTNAAHWRWLGNYFGLDEVSLAEMCIDFFAGDKLDEDLLAYIKRLREAGYRAGLLSNAYDDTRRILTETYPILPFFEGVIISAEVGLMKPDAQIYHLAAESLNVKPQEALFIDDSSRNIEGAKAVGMQTVHFSNPKTAQQQLVTITGVE